MEWTSSETRSAARWESGAGRCSTLQWRSSRRQGSSCSWTPRTIFKADERRLESRWHDIIEANLRALLRVHERFVIREHYTEVFGPTVGQAREKHLRQALRRLVAEGSTSTNEKGDLYPKTIVRAPGGQP